LSELYRQEIVIDVNDEDAISRIERVEKRVNKVFKDIVDRGKSVSRQRFNPTIDLKDRMTARLKTIQHTLRTVASKAWNITIAAKDKVTSVLNGIIKKMTSPIGLLGGATAGAAGVVYPLKLAGDMETARLSMDFFTESVEKGKQVMDDLLAFAAKTPFEFPFLRESATGLMGMYKGLTGDVDKTINETFRALRAFGDAAGRTGAGEQGMIGALLGFRQIGAIGQLNMEELRQVTENLLVPLELVRKELGLTNEQMKDIGNANIPAEKAMDAILRALEKNFGGGMGNLSKTFFGLWSTIKDTFRLSVMSYGDGMLDPVKRIFEDITGMTDYTSEDFGKFAEKLKSYGKSVGDFFENTYFQIKNVIKRYSNDPEFQKLDFAGKVSFVIGDLGKTIDDWFVEKGASKIGEYGAKIGTEMIKTMAVGAKEAIMNSTVLSFLLGGLIASKLPVPLPVQIAVAIGTALGAAAGKVLNYLIDNDMTLGNYLADKGITDKFENPDRKINKQIELYDQLKNKPEDEWLYPDTRLEAYVPLGNKIPLGGGHATGGIFDKPHVAWFAEDGRESVIPLDRHRNRAVDIWRQTGEILGQYSAGDDMGHNNFIPQVQAGSANINLNFDLQGLIGQILIQSKDEIEDKVNQAGQKFARELLRIIKNLSD